MGTSVDKIASELERISKDIQAARRVDSRYIMHDVRRGVVEIAELLDKLDHLRDQLSRAARNNFNRVEEEWEQDFQAFLQTRADPKDRVSGLDDWMESGKGYEEVAAARAWCEEIMNTADADDFKWVVKTFRDAYQDLQKQLK